ncbi:MAG: hypothetical protein MR210_06855 [Erysipelotrichaceae bacterium]|nr:hypothetical protein [Erysipelotrichaceae bacterium]MDY5252655.1 PssE/Cps14G family polysaccharide biosynthesis glycosyltransferase [Erysipelotrichaceae bacterium]
MILVTLGTQDKHFTRLIAMVDELIKDGTIQDEVFVQAGSTAYQSDKMQIFDYIDMESYEKLLAQCDVLITHGGVGTILSALKDGKIVIGVAREARYKEHHNDHQKEIIDSFSTQGLILKAEDVASLKMALAKAKTFEPKPFVSNNENFIKLISKELGI